MATPGFVEAPDAQNIIKTELVTKYFKAWSTLMLPRLRRPGDRLAYIDLFSGPGRFENGTPSTPLLILDQAINDPQLRSRLVATFNDKDPKLAEKLMAEIESLPGIETLVAKPQVNSVAVGDEVTEILRRSRLVPTLFFIDPWGYKGLSLDLIGSAIRNWGCDCIFFFNYNRINPGLNNPYVRELMNDLFGAERAEALRAKVADLTPDKRQSAIIDELTAALGDVGGRYVLPFEFESDKGERTSHYIIFVSKEFRGYHIMKDVMAGLSTDPGEVKRFENVPMRSPQMQLFLDIGREHSISALKDLLAIVCAGTTQTVVNVYEQNTVGTPYTLKNIKDAIIALEQEGRVLVDKPADKRMVKGKVTLGDKRIVTFPH